eukprot:12118017-Heterocapsa_arctica.AAC.1
MSVPMTGSSMLNVATLFSSMSTTAGLHCVMSMRTRQSSPSASMPHRPKLPCQLCASCQKKAW